MPACVPVGAHEGTSVNHAVFAALVVGLLALLPQAASAEPYMALRQGFTCGDCHTNRTGGGMRNLTAEMHAADILKLPNDGLGVLPAHDEWFSPNINEWFSVGADFRMTETVLFQDEPDENGEVDNNTAFRDLESNDFETEQATLYAHLRLIPGILSAYIDEKVAPGGADNRETFVLLEQLLPGEVYIKAGRFFPGWGLKVQDDDAFVSRTSGFNFDRTLSGVEFGRSGMGWNWSASASEGGDDFEQLLMASSYYVWGETGPLNGAMLGASAARHEPSDLEALSYTAFGGFSCGALTVLTQGVYLDSELHETDEEDDQIVVDNTAWAAYVEANYLINGWVNMKVAFDYFEPDDELDEDARNRVSIGIEPFLDRFLQLRVFYRVYNGPEDDPTSNRDELTLEAHLLL